MKLKYFVFKLDSGLEKNDEEKQTTLHNNKKNQDLVINREYFNLRGMRLLLIK